MQIITTVNEITIVTSDKEITMYEEKGMYWAVIPKEEIIEMYTPRYNIPIPEKVHINMRHVIMIRKELLL